MSPQPEKNNPTILLVEDDLRLANLVSEYMQNHGFEVSIETRGDTAVDAILTKQPNLIILDLMLPGIDGLEVCRRVRHKFHGIILMLTAMDEDIDQIVGLELGADDYVIKPVEPRVLLARIKSLLRRAPQASYSQNPQAKVQAQVQAQSPDLKSSDIIAGPLNISLQRRSVTLDGQDIRLTTGEFDLLWYLASHSGEVISRDHLYQTLNGIEYDGVDRAMDIRVSRLRKLLGDDSHNPCRIKTVRGKGYLFIADECGS
jgi:DNA-binding response OmpR family regulator